jgi:hypothetical protein
MKLGGGAVVYHHPSYARNRLCAVWSFGILNLVGKLEGKFPLGRPWSRWEDIIIMDIRKIGWEIVDRMHLARDRLL